MSQSPADGPEPEPGWGAFSGDDAPPPGPELAGLLGGAVGALGGLGARQLLGVASAGERRSQSNRMSDPAR